MTITNAKQVIMEEGNGKNCRDPTKTEPRPNAEYTAFRDTKYSNTMQSSVRTVAQD